MMHFFGTTLLGLMWLVLGTIVFVIVLRMIRDLRSGEWKNLMFTWTGWYVTAVHDLILFGAAGFALFVAMQWSGINVAIQLPTIEHTFRK